MAALGHKMLHDTDAAVAGLAPAEVSEKLAAANEALAADLKRATEELLGQVLYTTSCAMKNSFAMSDNVRE